MIDIAYKIVLILFSVWLSASQSVNKKDSLAERVSQLVELSIKLPIIRLNTDRYKNFVKSTPRNYSMVVMFTAMAAHRQCVVCKHANDEFQIVANSYRYSQFYSNKLFFGVVDFDEGADVFQQLNLNTAPVFMHFPAKGKPKKSDTMDLQRIGLSSESLAKWVAERTDIHIRIFRPPNYSGSIALIAMFALLAIIFYFRRNSLSFLYNTSTWAVLSLVFAFLMTSGQMWNHIRSPPLLHKSQHGNVIYIHSSSQGQFIMETYIIIMINAAIVQIPKMENTWKHPPRW